MKKILYILRHAKAKVIAAGQEDHERGLTGHGVEDARHMGAYMTAHGIAPNMVLCSTAERTRETVSGLTYKGKVEYTDKLYLASANEIINLLGKTPETTHSLMIVGHNPGLHQLCLTLAKSGDQALLDRLAVKFPTCALATIIFEGAAWRTIGREGGRIAGFITPKMLAADASD